MKKASVFAGFAGFLITFLVAISGWALSYPTAPDSQLTPGVLCKRPSSYRYQEKIPYCERSVSPELKQVVISKYNQQLGYRILPKDRSAFKIDHLVPLCAGGANEIGNLWPQHARIYQKTDPVEALVCEKMKIGRLSQRVAIELIREAKADPNSAFAIFEKINAL